MWPKTPLTWVLTCLHLAQASSVVYLTREHSTSVTTDSIWWGYIDLFPQYLPATTGENDNSPLTLCKISLNQFSFLQSPEIFIFPHVFEVKVEYLNTNCLAILDQNMLAN